MDVIWLLFKYNISREDNPVNEPFAMDVIWLKFKYKTVVVVGMPEGICVRELIRQLYTGPACRQTALTT